MLIRVHIYIYIEYCAVYQTYYVCNHAFSVELVVATAASCWPKIMFFPYVLTFYDYICIYIYNTNPVAATVHMILNLAVDIPMLSTLHAHFNPAFQASFCNSISILWVAPKNNNSWCRHHPQVIKSVAAMNPQHEHPHQHDSSSSPLWKLPLSYNIWLHHHSPEIFSTITSDHSAYVGFLKQGTPSSDPFMDIYIYTYILYIIYYILYIIYYILYIIYYISYIILYISYISYISYIYIVHPLPLVTINIH